MFGFLIFIIFITNSLFSIILFTLQTNLIVVINFSASTLLIFYVVKLPSKAKWGRAGGLDEEESLKMNILDAVRDSSFNWITAKLENVIGTEGMSRRTLKR